MSPAPARIIDDHPMRAILGAIVGHKLAGGGVEVDHSCGGCDWLRMRGDAQDAVQTESTARILRDQMPVVDVPSPTLSMPASLMRVTVPLLLENLISDADGEIETISAPE